MNIEGGRTSKKSKLSSQENSLSSTSSGNRLPKAEVTSDAIDAIAESLWGIVKPSVPEPASAITDDFNGDDMIAD